MFETVTHIAALPRRILDDRRNATGAFKSHINALGNSVETLLHGDFVQMAARMEVKHLQAQLLAAAHFVEERRTRLLQALFVGAAKVNKIAIVGKNVARVKITLF